MNNEALCWSLAHVLFAERPVNWGQACNLTLVSLLVNLFLIADQFIDVQLTVIVAITSVFEAENSDY